MKNKTYQKEQGKLSDITDALKNIKITKPTKKSYNGIGVNYVKFDEVGQMNPFYIMDEVGATKIDESFNYE